MTQCQATVKGTRKRCRKAAIEGSDYCVVHRPNLRAQLFLSVAAGHVKSVTPKSLRRIRSGVGLSQADMAKVLGISFRQYSYKETGAKAIEPWLALAMVTLREIRGK